MLCRLEKHVGKVSCQKNLFRSFLVLSEMDSTTKPPTVKVVFIGAPGVGKTSIQRRWKFNTFEDNPAVTTLICIQAMVTLRDGRNQLKLDLWDTAGQERYCCLSPMYFRRSCGALLCFDLTNRETFIQAKDIWLKQISEHSPNNARTILIGNKADLAQLRQVSTEEAQEFAKQAGFPYIETSAREGININEAIKILLDEIEDAGPIEDSYAQPFKPPPPSRSWCTIL